MCELFHVRLKLRRSTRSYIPVSLTIDEVTVQRAIKIGHLSCDPSVCPLSEINYRTVSC